MLNHRGGGWNDPQGEDSAIFGGGDFFRPAELRDLLADNVAPACFELGNGRTLVRDGFPSEALKSKPDWLGRLAKGARTPMSKPDTGFSFGNGVERGTVRHLGTVPRESGEGKAVIIRCTRI